MLDSWEFWVRYLDQTKTSMAALHTKKTCSATFVPVALKNSYHPLHLFVGKTAWSLLNLGEDDSVEFISISNCMGGFSSDSLLATVCRLDSATLDSAMIPTHDVEYGPLINLYCCYEFLNHYKFLPHQNIYIRPINVFPTKSITLVAKTQEAYKWTSNKSFSVGMLCSVCQNKCLVRKGDKLLSLAPPAFQNNASNYHELWNNIEIIDCYPMKQGCLSVKTEIVVVPQVHESFQSKLNYGLDATPQAVLMSDFLTGGVVFNNLSSNDDEPSLELFSQPAEYFDSLPFNIQSNHLAVAQHFPNELQLDNYNCIAISVKTSKTFGLFHGAMVDITLPSEVEDPSLVRKTISNDAHQKSLSTKHVRNGSIIESRPKKKVMKHFRIVQVRVVTESDLSDFSLSDDSYMVTFPPSLWFHLNKEIGAKTPDAVLIKKHQSLPEDSVSASGSWSGELPVASEIHISVVISPQYSAGATFNTAIQHFFSTPRLIKKEDVLSIPSNVDPEFYQELADGTHTRKPVVHFKVHKMLPKIKGHTTFVVDNRRTTLYQDGTDHSYIPVAMSNLIDQSLKPEISGLDHYIENTSSVLQPHLISRGHCEELMPSVLLTGPAGCGKTAVCQRVSARLNLHLYSVNCYELGGETSAATEARIKHQMQRACSYAPCLLLLQNVHALGKERDGHTEDSRVAGSFHKALQKLTEDSPQWPIVVVATAPAPKLLTSDMHEGFLHHIDMKVPDEKTRHAMITSLLQDTCCASDVSAKHIAQRTAGMVLGDLSALVSQAKKAAYKKAVEFCCHGNHRLSHEEEEDIHIAGLVLEQSDFSTALDQMQAAHSDAIGAPKIPNVTWDDVGGLVKVKADILDTVQLPLQHPEMFAAGLRRSGVLLYGPPGTGKTLLAKAVATECSLNFLSVKGPELINMYVGQSEENIREVFGRARSASPCVIFFDELDSLAPNRGRSGDSGGVMDRVVSQLLAELDGLHKSCDVFVIGATNRPDLLDPALLRPGRFDKLLYLGVSEDKDSQLKIVKALTRKFSLTSGCVLDRVVERCPFNMTGADFYALCSDAMLNAMKRKINKLDMGEEEDDCHLQVSEEDFQEARAHLIPSVSDAELQHYKTIQTHFAVQR